MMSKKTSASQNETTAKEPEDIINPTPKQPDFIDTVINISKNRAQFRGTNLFLDEEQKISNLYKTRYTEAELSAKNLELFGNREQNTAPTQEDVIVSQRKIAEVEHKSGPLTMPNINAIILEK